MHEVINTRSVADYRRFLAIKSLPTYRFSGHVAEFPDEYAATMGVKPVAAKASGYMAPEWMYDYQRAITPMAIEKRKFCLFIDCGYGKTPIHLEFARHALSKLRRKNVLIVAPLMVVRQELQEIAKFYGGAYPIEPIPANKLQAFLDGGSGIGITNYEAITDSLTPGKLGGLVLSESSMLKNHYGKWGTKLIELGRGLEWKLCETGTPAPNDRIEYANHAVFMDAFPNVNSFLARYFINRGQTQERWELRPHALTAFYRALSHWSIFMTNPATYGWTDNAGTLPPIETFIHDVDLTTEQRDAVREHTGQLFVTSMGGIASRSKLARIGKGTNNGERIDSDKPGFVRDLVRSWPDRSTLVWCIYNDEQDHLAKLLPEAASMSGDTPHAERERIIDDFKAGRIKTLISKSKVLGFGLNLQVATRHVFSSLQDSYESYYQCIKRSNRVGSKEPLQVHIPITEVERPMVDNVLRKASMVQEDTVTQERLFRNANR